MPDICVIEVPLIYASPSLALGRYYPVIIESDGEWDEWDRFLDAERVAPVAPDLLDRRPSALTASTITFAHYDPPASGWPWILLCRWPLDHVALAIDTIDLFARSAYSIEVAPDAAARFVIERQLLQTLGQQGPVDISYIPPMTVAGVG